MDFCHLLWIGRADLTTSTLFSITGEIEFTVNNISKYIIWIEIYFIRNNRMRQHKALYILHGTYCNQISEETTFAQPSVTTYMHDNMPRRRVCSWGFKDINPNSPDPVCYRTMEAATYEEAQRTCRRMFADILTLPDERYSIEGEFSLEWKILCEVGLNQSKYMIMWEFHVIKTIQIQWSSLRT